MAMAPEARTKIVFADEDQQKRTRNRSLSVASRESALVVHGSRGISIVRSRHEVTTFGDITEWLDLVNAVEYVD
jgi:hypothetical protein